MQTQSGIDPSDPIDELIPPPRPWWLRLVVGLAIVSTVGVGAALWGFGVVYPQPDCCGSGDFSPMMSLTADGKAVTVTATMFNSSGRDLKITSASAELPGATVLGIALVDESNHTFPISRTRPLPTVIGSIGQLAITFLPTGCLDDQRPWGKVTVRLDVVNGSMPSLGRTYVFPDPVVPAGNNLTVLAPQSRQQAASIGTPLAAACALLGR